jgi:tetratricopeptide (TPR) repeat protein
MRLFRGELKAARRIVGRLQKLSGELDDWYLRAAVASQGNNVMTLSGHLARADSFYDECRESYARAEHHPVATLTVDPLTTALLATAIREWMRGHLAEAGSHLEAAGEHSERIDHPFSRAYVGVFGAAAARLFGWSADRSWNLLEQGTRIATALDSVGLLAFARVVEPMLDPAAAASVADTSDRVARVEAALIENRTGYHFMQAFAIAELARMLDRAGRYHEALGKLDTAVSEALHDHDRFLAPEVLRRRGELLGRMGRVEEADAALGESLRVARRMGAVGHELMAALSLARLRVEAGRSTAARKTLTTTLARLEPGVDLPERAEAEALHAELTADQSPRSSQPSISRAAR